MELIFNQILGNTKSLETQDHGSLRIPTRSGGVFPVAGALQRLLEEFSDEGNRLS